MALLAALSMLPFLGITDFYTKGEPREAIVAVSMLTDNNWILPTNNGGDIAYKPPLLHWCIALLFKTLGTCNEYLSRLPSALSFIGLIVGTFFFFARFAGVHRALLTALLTMTAFEVHRAGNNCRVDMMLTVFIVSATYLLYIWHHDGRRQVPWLAILCMSLGTLTKGPVAIILPCLAVGVFMLTNGATLKRMALVPLWAVMSMGLPLIWYVAAYKQGGSEFLRLVIEENFDRFTGQMSYSSHVKPVYYNVLTLLAGWLPWTPMVLVVLWQWRKQRLSWADLRKLFGRQTGIRRFALTAFLSIFLFYCIPESKRSTYLLPCYPFMAYLLADFILWFIRQTDGMWLRRNLRKAVAGVMLLFALVDGVIFPLAIRNRSDESLAQYIAQTYKRQPVYSYLSDTMLNFYGTDFYLHDRIADFRDVNPRCGILMMAEQDVASFRKNYGNKYNLQLVGRTTRPRTELHDYIRFYKFCSKNKKKSLKISKALHC